MTSKQHALELFPRDVDAIVADLGLPQYSSKQILDWIYTKSFSHHFLNKYLNKKHLILNFMLLETVLEHSDL